MRNIDIRKTGTVSLTLMGILFLSIVYLCSTNAYAAVFDVPGDFATIQEAIDDPGTVDGDVINVLAVTHVESSINITKDLTIRGQGIGSTIIDPSTIDGFTTVFFPEVANITIRDMTIQNADEAIRFNDSGGTINNTLIRDVEFLNNAVRDIEIHNGTTVTNLRILLCSFENGPHGLRVSSSGHIAGAIIRDSSFDNNDIGIYVANDGGTSTMSDVIIRNNIFENQGRAIYVEEIQSTRILNNMFMNNERDIQILKWYQPSIPVSGVLIRGNTMIGTTDAVFGLFNADNGGQTVFNNVEFIRNNAITAGASAVFVGGHRAGPPSAGGTGWDTVEINNNCFTGLTTGNGVRFFVPVGIPDNEALGAPGTMLNVQDNFWGVPDIIVPTLMQIPGIVDFDDPRQNCPLNFGRKIGRR